ncbi:MAG: secretin N-terminal domain-containing protein [Aquabacterium sp.]|nr:secretin N-terminal domain-containing protein [Aquabacterium sp.]
MLAGGRTADGLRKLQEAVAQAPDNVQYRALLLTTRLKWTDTLIRQGRQALRDGRPDDARQAFERVLAVDSAHVAARTGLAQAQQQERSADLVRQASADWAGGKSDSARARLASVLADDPTHAHAIELRRQIAAADEAALAAASTKGPWAAKVSIDFKDASVKQVFDVISRASGLNILLDKDVRADQKISLALRDVTSSAAIQYLLMANQLEQLVMDGNTLFIYPNTPAKLRDYQPLLVKTFVLNNANAKAVAELIKTLVKSRDVVVDEKLNMVMVRDSAEAIGLAERLVALQDVAEPEVMLEVDVLEVGRDLLTELGLAWPGGLTLMPIPADRSGGLTLGSLRNLNAATLGATIDAAKLNLRQEDGNSNLLANPRIRVLNREKARVMIGNRVPSVSTTVNATGFATESVTYLDVGLKLEVEPTIFVNGDITIRLALEVSNIVSTQKTASGSSTYTIGTRAANTTLRLKDGETQVLAGLISEEDRRSATKVPGLGDLPLAGPMFSSTLANGKRSEIVLSITPRLVRNQTQPSPGASAVPSGTESTVRQRAASPGTPALAP